MTRPFTVAYVCADPGIPVFGTKGASVHIQEIVRAWRRRGAHVEIFCVRAGELWTSTAQYSLPGITRGVVLEVARADRMATHEAPFTLTDVYGADEAFVTGTFGGLTPVRVVDGRTIGDGAEGPVTRRLRERYDAAVAASVARGGVE